jgi:hypothetical protein
MGPLSAFGRTCAFAGATGRIEAIWGCGIAGGHLAWKVNMLTGRCLCGACSYEIEGDPVVVAHCHCLDCQRLSGAGHSTGAMFPEGAITLTGTPAAFSLSSAAGNSVTRLFCGTCGSPLFGKNSGMPGFATVTLGTLDAPNMLTPQVAIFVRTRRQWDVMDPAIATFDAQSGWKPADGV